MNKDKTDITGNYESPDGSCKLEINADDNGTHIRVLDHSLNILYYWLLSSGEVKDFEVYWKD